MDETLVHGTCIALGNIGVLIQGPPGSGKSDLALRMIDQPGFGHGGSLLAARLVADDQVLVGRIADGLTARSPAAIKDLLEIRGLGVVSVKSALTIKLALIVRLSASETIDRMPELEACKAELLGVSLPLVFIDAGQPSAPARLRSTVVHLFGGRMGGAEPG